MIELEQFQLWFVTGSQDLYGEETLKQVAKDSKTIAQYLSAKMPVNVIYKPVLTTPKSISQLCQQANNDKKCIGLVTWMHTFSPAKMWIAGLNSLAKPFVHLHTQFNKNIPWENIDMDFMNLNQSAHGGREFGFIGTRLRKNRKVIVGFWQDPDVLNQLDIWTRAAVAWQDWQGMKVARFGDNMREVAVTEGDKVEAQIKFGYSVNGYGIGDLVEYVNSVSDFQIENHIEALEQNYNISDELKSESDGYASLKESSRIELGMRAFLKEGGFKAFTTTFEDLHGLTQLPGMAVQRLMADGFGFGAEGDWKTAALVRAMKVMGTGLDGGCSFMEDYTYHLDENGMKVLGAHMLEVCQSIGDPATIQVKSHPLGIGGKADPVRLVFNVPPGPAVNASIIDLGNRFRMLVNSVDVVAPDEELPKLPVARVVWKPKPNLKTSAAAWILAGGAHHTGFSQAITSEHLVDFAEMADIELVLIDEKTTIIDFKKELRWNEVYYYLARGL
jgi:L-arabinose isomerase